jgi:lincosamide nucleotidyltransferase A/C/D/E
MTAEEALHIYKSLDEEGIRVWIDGGWAVDALLGEQTRPHHDLDLAVEHKDLPTLRNIFSLQGFTSIERDSELMWDLVLSNNEGKEIEVHTFSFNENGKVIEEEPWNGYSVNSLTGVGKILNTEVRCVSLEQLVKTHDKNKRKLKPSDLQDMQQLERRFGAQFP